jgi:hypothetical protein
VVAKVSETDNTYEGSNTAVLTIGKRAGVIVGKSDTIRAGTGFNAGNYSASGFLSGDEPSGSLVTHLRSVTNTNPLVSYQSSSTLGGVYRILRGSAGDNVSNNYSIEYREGTLTVLKDSILTEGTVVPLAAGFNYTLVVQNSNRTVSAFGGNSNVVGVVPAILTNGTAEVVGVGSGAGNNFGMAWTRDGQPVVWGGTPGVTPVGLTNIAAMAGGARLFVGGVSKAVAGRGMKGGSTLCLSRKPRPNFPRNPSSTAPYPSLQMVVLERDDDDDDDDDDDHDDDEMILGNKQSSKSSLHRSSRKSPSRSPPTPSNAKGIVIIISL